MNLPDCNCIPYALYLTENFIDNNRALFRHSCVTVTHLRTHVCAASSHQGTYALLTSLEPSVLTL